MFNLIRLWAWLGVAEAGAAPASAPGPAPAPAPFLPGVHRIVILGDSITYSGQYIDYLEAYAVTRFPERTIEFINLGLPSETVSGLSEPGHAGGAFPRPDLHERLARVLGADHRVGLLIEGIHRIEIVRFFE